MTTETQAPEGADERAAFEEWISHQSSPLHLYGLGRDESDRYGVDIVQAAWWAWQARDALAAQPTRSQRLRDAGITRRPSWKSLPGAIDGDDEAPAPAEAHGDASKYQIDAAQFTVAPWDPTPWMIACGESVMMTGGKLADAYRTMLGSGPFHPAVMADSPFIVGGPQLDVQPKGTPSSQWAANGEPDPHGDRYACERAALTLGELTDDELANGAFLNYNEPLNIKAVMENRPGYHPPIAWMTAVKDRIRWLSRALEKANAAQAPAPAHGLEVIDADAWEPCSPAWLRAGGCCASAPRLWHAATRNHWHPKITQAPAVAHATEYDQVLSEMDGTGCPRCLGSGSVPAMSNGGPDAHEIDVDCHHCGGTGSARDAYLKLAEFYSKANSELTQLRYYRWFNEQEKAKQAEKLEAAQQHAYAEGRKDEAESRQPGVEDYASGFRDGWIDCRRTMAGLVEPDSAVIAMSIRGNWKPSLGPDPDRPACQRCNGTGEVNEGDPEIGNAYFDCPACSQPPKPAFVVPVQGTQA